MVEYANIYPDAEHGEFEEMKQHADKDGEMVHIILGNPDAAALEIIESERWRHFDPEAADLILSLARHFLK